MAVVLLVRDDTDPGLRPLKPSLEVHIEALHVAVALQRGTWYQALPRVSAQASVTVLVVCDESEQGGSTVGDPQPLEALSHSHADTETGKGEEVVRGQFSLVCVEATRSCTGVVGVSVCPVARSVVERSLK